MHTEHKPLKWCAVVMTFIVAIATIAGMFYLPVSGKALLPEEGPAITRLPEEMPETLEAKDLKAYEAKEQEEEPEIKSLTDIMKEYISEQEPGTVTGTVVYGIRGRKWALISVDPALFYNYYGFPQKTEGKTE